MTIKMSIRKSYLPLATILLGIAFAAGSVHAQDQATDDQDAPGRLEEVLVTAEFRETNLQETPIAITAITAEMLAARGQTSIYEVAAQSPNVSLMPGGMARSGMMAFIRGIGQTDFSPALEPGVGIYVDDVYYTQLTGSLLDLLDLERVEILRGPQGTLAGRNSIGGAIKLYTRKPDEDGGGMAKVSYGSFNKVDVRASTDITLVPDRLYARVAGAARERDGHIDVLDYECTHPGSGLPTNHGAAGCLLDKWGGKSYTTARAQLRWLASDNVEINFSFDYLNDKSPPPGMTLLWADRTFIESIAIPGPGFLDPNASSHYLNPTISYDENTPVYYRDHNFVPYGPFRNANDPINDPYVNYATFSDGGPQYLDAGAPGGTGPHTQPAPWKPFNTPGRNYLNQWGAAMNLNWTISDNLELVWIGAYREWDAWSTWDSDLSPIPVTQLDNRLDNWQHTQEIRLNGSMGNVDYTIGGFYLDQNSHYEARVDLNYALIDFIHGPDPTPAKTWAVFAHSTWHISDRLDISGGVRYSDETKDYTHFRHNPDGSDIGSFGPTFPDAVHPFLPIQFFDLVNFRLSGMNGLEDHFEDTITDWRVAANYSVRDDLMVYGSASTGYKSGGVNSRPFFPIQLRSFNPESLTSYEIGFKSTLLDNSLRLNAAAFFTKYDDVQLRLLQCEIAIPPFFGPPCLQPRNVGNAEIKGLEFEIEWYLTESLSIDAAASFLDFKYTDIFDDNVLTGSVIAPIDMITPYTPEEKFSLGIQYNFPASERGGLHVRLDATHQGEVYTVPTNDPLNLIDSYTITNARLWWDSPDQDWSIELVVRNLGDKVYYLTKWDEYRSVGQIMGQPGLPRTWEVGISRKF